MPIGGAPDPQQCFVAEHAGRVWVHSSATSGKQLFLCEGASGWHVYGDANHSTPQNVGYISSLPISTPISAQPSVGSANQVRLVQASIPVQVRLARLAASIATESIDGNARLGVYRTDGTLIAQTGILDTSAAVVRDGTVSPVVLEPGFYYFAWSVDNTTAQLAGSSTPMMSGLFNRVAASPGQATCDESMTPAGLPSVCTLIALPDNDSFPVIAIAGFAQ